MNTRRVGCIQGAVTQAVKIVSVILEISTALKLGSILLADKNISPVKRVFEMDLGRYRSTFELFPNE